MAILLALGVSPKTTRYSTEVRLIECEAGVDELRFATSELADKAKDLEFDLREAKTNIYSLQLDADKLKSRHADEDLRAISTSVFDGPEYRIKQLEASNRELRQAVSELQDELHRGNQHQFLPTVLVSP